jgi:hypothetical protein
MNVYPMGQFFTSHPIPRGALVYILLVFFYPTRSLVSIFSIAPYWVHQDESFADYVHCIHSLLPFTLYQVTVFIILKHFFTKTCYYIFSKLIMLPSLVTQSTIFYSKRF